MSFGIAIRAVSRRFFVAGKFLKKVIGILEIGIVLQVYS